MSYQLSWRIAFSDAELQQIQNAPPNSIIARLAELLEQRDGRLRRAAQSVSGRIPDDATEVRRFEE